VTIDTDATDAEVYGSGKRGVAYNYQGQRCGRPHVASGAQTETVLAADLLAGDVDPRPGAGRRRLLRRVLAALPAQARASRVALRADAGYFAGELARAAHAEGIGFAIGAKRIAPLCGCWPASPNRTGPRRSAWTARRSRNTTWATFCGSGAPSAELAPG
jgi:Transposase DDE domain group 1